MQRSKMVPWLFNLVIVSGIVLIASGLSGIFFTYQKVGQEKIITPEDASLSQVPVRGPFSLKAQAGVIREHTLSMTDGKTYAEMPRSVAKLDADGNVMVGADGTPVMTANTARDIWITATTLTTALYLAMFAYAFFGFIVISGLVLVIIGVACHLSMKAKATQM